MSSRSNPYDVPEDLYILLTDVEILTETLNWINQRSVKKDLVTKLDLIALKLNSIIRDLKRQKLCSEKDIATLQVAANSFITFRSMVEKDLPSRNPENEIKGLQKNLENNFEKIVKLLIAVMQKLKLAIQKQQKLKMTYN